MKTLKTLSLLLICAFGMAIIFTSCRKDDDGGDGADASAGTIKAKVSGSDFKSEGQMATATYVAQGKMLTIYGIDTNGRAVQIIINNYDSSTGTWKIPNGTGSIGVVGSYIEANTSGAQTWVAPYEGSGEIGEVKISEFSATGSVKGTFSFKARKQNDNSSFKEVNEGSFNLTVKSY